MAVNLQVLKDEFVTNPAALPYLALDPANDAANADVVNNASGANPRTVNNDVVDTGEMRGQTTFDAFDGLVTAEQAWFEWLTANGVIPVTTDTLLQLAGIGGNSIWAVADRPVMEPRMTALMQRQGSRAEEIAETLGASVVTPSDVANARQLP